mmetsp:Transcript_10666/g.15732  ORF Transcript_10666/g.15732 Transcript_10666/m.15732 type:complete len:189 (+) Transcript_10666:100-666(+)
MGLFSGLTKSDGGEYQNVGSATTSCGGEEPPLVTATPISSSTAAAASSLPTVAEAINISKLAAAGASTAAVGATSALSNATNTAATHNSYSASSQQQRQSDNGSLGRFPTSIDTCPHCRTANIATKMRTYPTCETWGMIIALFFVFWPVCWFPLVMDSCKTTDHYCTNCNEHVGRVKPLSDCCVKEMG